MARIFISHNSNDAREAAALKRWLTDNGWDDVFLDLDAKDGLKPGENSWKDALTNAIDRCEAVLCLVSPTWLASKECEVEYRYAENKKRSIFLLPIKACDPTGHVSSERQWSPLFGDGAQTSIPFDFRGQPAECSFLSDGLERLKYGLIDAGINADYFAWPPEKDPKRAPYRGLNPLEAEDAAVFFGRDAQIHDGMEELRVMRRNDSERLLVILGSSGSGKSSFMRAGLLPRLKRDDRHFFPLPVIRPRNAVISGPDGLAQSLVRAFEELGSNITLGRIEQELNSEPQALATLLADLNQRLFEQVMGEYDAMPPSIVIPIDQGEELFNPDGAMEAERFLDLLAQQLNEPDADVDQPVSAGSLARILVLLTIRSDRYERLQLTQGLSSVKPRLFDLRPISPGQFERVINGPAERATRAGRKLIIEASLTARLLDDFEKGADTLPLLGFVLEMLYLKFGTDGDLTLDEYERIRGSHQTVQAAIFEEAVKTALEEPYRPPSIPAEQKEQDQALRKAFIPYLVRINPENDEPMRQVAKLGDSPEELPENLRPFVERLVKARLLTQAKGDTIEVAHESLFRQWPSLDGWITQERDNLRLLGGIRQSATEWKKEQGTADRRDGLLLHQDARLADALNLLAMPGYVVSVDSNERAYLNACIGKQEERVAKEKEEQEQRLLDAKRIAEEQTKTASAQKSAMRASLIGLVVALFVAGVAFWYWLEADRQLIESEASALWHPLNFSTEGTDEEKQRAGLMALARSGKRQKQAFLKRVLSDNTLAARFSTQPTVILRSSVGLNEEIRTWFLDLLNESPQKTGTTDELRVARTLALTGLEGELTFEGLIAAIQSTKDSNQLKAFGQGLVMAAGKLPEAQAGEVADRFLAVLLAPEDVKKHQPWALTDEFLGAVEAMKDQGQLYALGQGLVAVAGKVQEAQARAVADRFLAAIRDAKDWKQLQQLGTVGQGLAALVNNVPEAQAMAMVDRFLAALQDTKDQKQVDALSQGLVAIAGKVLEADAGAVANRFLTEILATKDQRQIDALSQGLVAVAGKVQEADAGAVANRFLAAILVTKDWKQLEDLSQGLAVVVSKLPKAQAGALANKVLTAIQATKDSNQLKAFGQGFAAVAGKVPEAETATVADNVLTAIQATKDSNQLKAFGQGLVAVAGKVPEAQAVAVAENILTAIHVTGDENQLLALVQGLAALPETLSEAQAGAMADRFLDAIRETKALSPEHLIKGLAAVAGKTQVGTVADKILTAIRTTEDGKQLQTLGQSLVELVGRVPELNAGAMADRLLAAILTTNDWTQLDALNRGLAPVALKVPKADAEAVADRFLTAILDTKDWKQLGILGPCLATVADKVPEAQAGTVVDRFLAALQATKDQNQTEALGQGLLAVTSKVPEAGARAMADRFLALRQNTKDQNQLEALSRGLSAVADKVPGVQAGAVADRILAALQALRVEKDTHIRGALGMGLAAAAGKVPEAQAAAVAERFLAALQAEEYLDLRESLGEGLAAVSGKVPEAQTGAVADRLLAALQTTEEPYRIQALVQGMAVVAGKISSNDKSASLLFETLKYPFVDSDTITDVIRKRFSDTPPKEQGFWALIKWAKKNFQGLNLEAPLAQPANIAAGTTPPGKPMVMK